MDDRIGQIWVHEDGPQPIFLIVKSENKLHTTVNLLSGVQEYKISEDGNSTKLENWGDAERVA